MVRLVFRPWDRGGPCRGNILRPDMARAMHGLFWGIADLPDWYRASECAALLKVLQSGLALLGTWDFRGGAGGSKQLQLH